MDPRQTWPSRVREAAQTFGDVVRAVPAELLDAKSAGDEWSVRETVLHLSDASVAYSVRLRRMLTEEHPVLQVIDEDRWRRRLCKRERSLPAALGVIAALYESAADLLEHTSEADWKREGYHPAKGDVTLEESVRGMVERALEHAERIRDIVRRPSR